jgi:hypothetical protein
LFIFICCIAKYLMEVIGAFVPIAYWSLLEVDIGVICACLPGVRAFLARCFPDWFPSTRGTPSGSSDGSSNIPQSRMAIQAKHQAKRSTINFIPLVEVEQRGLPEED